tara:strand:+ start:1677 stop:3617 length:1941 start_codon:yes stop_codon:yes gene_type:complete
MATQTIDYNINVNAGGSLRTIQDIENELKALNDEIKDVGVGSKVFQKAAGNIQKLEKELTKANNAVEGFTLDKKLEAADGAIKITAGAVSGLVGGLGLLGIQSESFDKLTAQATSAIAFGMGLKDISEGYKQIVKSEAAAAIGAKLFGTTTKAALIATGIGALIVALGVIIAYWDDISAVVSGVSTEMGDSLDSQKDMVALSEQQFDAISATENTLRLSGATEREIRDLKIQQTDETIKALEAQLITQQEVKKAQVAAAERNQAIAQGVIRFLSLPITILLATVDSLTAALSNIPGLGDISTNLEEGFSGGIASLLFDPEEVAEEGNAAIAETEKILAQLKNRRDGFKLKEKEEDAADRAERKTNEKTDEDEEKARIQALADLKSQIRDAEANTVAEQRAKELEDIQAHYDALILLAEENDILTDELKLSRDEVVLEAKQRFLNEDLAIKQTAADSEAALEQQKMDLKKQSLDTLTQLFGAETALGKAALIAKQAILLRELIINVKSTISAAKTTVVKSSLKGAEATVDGASGLMKTAASAPTPINVPLIIGYVAAAVGIIGAVKAAISNSKSVAAQAGGGGGGGGNITAPVAPAAPTISPDNIDLGVSPETQVNDNSVQAYVISGDISSAQEAESKLNSRRTISG